MKKVAALVLVLGFASSAFAGTVTFDALGSTSVIAGETVQFDLTINRDGNAMFNLANIVAGSNDLGIVSFDYAQSWLDAASFPPSAPVSTGFAWPSDLFFGGFLAAGTPGALVGTLTVDTTGLALGEYTVAVDSNTDFLSNIGLDNDTEGLAGSAIVTVVPEPATLILLGIGGVAAMRRRRR